jgi:hypothetical protein
MVETTLVVLIVGAALAWAAREAWQALRPKRTTTSGGCPSAGRCAVARNCGQAADKPSVERPLGARNTGPRAS